MPEITPPLTREFSVLNASGRLPPTVASTAESTDNARVGLETALTLIEATAAPPRVLCTRPNAAEAALTLTNCTTT